MNLPIDFIQFEYDSEGQVAAFYVKRQRERGILENRYSKERLGLYGDQKEVEMIVLDLSKKDVGSYLLRTTKGGEVGNQDVGL